MSCYDFGWLKAIFKTRKSESEASHNREVSQLKVSEYKVAAPKEPATTSGGSEGSPSLPVPAPAEPPMIAAVSEKAPVPPAITQKTKTQEDHNIATEVSHNCELPQSKVSEDKVAGPVEPPTTTLVPEEISAPPVAAPAIAPPLTINDASEEAPAPPAIVPAKNKSQGNHDILIAVMSATGVGKTTFIRSLTTTFDQESGHHGLEAGTRDVTTYNIDLPGVEGHLVLVDTPGFDDPARPDAEVLEEIANWMKETYKEGRLLNGLIYLHRITDIRFDAGVASTMNIFKKLYGGKGYQKLALVTTMWNNVRDNKATEYATRETELKTMAWGSFLQRQANEAALVARFNSTNDLTAKDSALKVISDLLKQSIDSEDLITRLQEELVDESKALPNTEAGRAAFTLKETAKYYLRHIR